MSYDDLPLLHYPDDTRNKINDADLIFCHGRKLLHFGIRLFTGEYENHVAFLFWWNGRAIVLEAGEHGVSTIPLSRFLREYPGRVYLARCSDVMTLGQGIAIHNAAVDNYLGADYDTWTLFRLAARKTLGKIGYKGKVPKNKRWFCSELIKDAMGDVGIEFDADEQGVISPGGIAKDPRIKMLGRLVMPPVTV